MFSILFIWLNSSDVSKNSLFGDIKKKLRETLKYKPAPKVANSWLSVIWRFHDSPLQCLSLSLSKAEAHKGEVDI